MNQMKIAAATILAAISITAAPIAFADQTWHTLDILWTKQDGSTTRGVLTVPGASGGFTPFAVSAGNTIGYATCQSDGTTPSLTTAQKFIGKTLVVQPVGMDGTRLKLHLSAMDTQETGTETLGSSECPTQVIHTTGLDVGPIEASITDGESIAVSLGDPRYRLTIRMSPEKD